jgi:hypothetical protein
MDAARGKPLHIRKHAYEGMMCERPPVRVDDVAEALGRPDHDDGSQARRWLGGRTVIVYYAEHEDAIYVRAVSASRRRF